MTVELILQGASRETAQTVFNALDAYKVMLPPTLERSIFPLRLQFENALQMVAGKVPPIGYALPAFFAMSAATSGAQSSWRK